MSAVNAVKIVEDFWAAVWQARNPEAIDQFVSEDFTITAGGIDVVSRASFKKWVARMFEMISDFDFRVIETFQNSDGSRVASRWRITGKNNGLFGTPPNQESIVLTGAAVWQVSPDGKLLHNWVKRSLWEVYQID